MTKSIVEKLNLQKYDQAAVLNEPEGTDYLAELTGYTTTLSDRAYDLIFAFVLDMESLKKLVERVIEHQHLNKNGYLFAAYPKKGNKVYSTFIHRDDLLAGLGSDENGYIGTSNIKFARMVGLDDIFTVVGLKEDAKSKNKTSSKPSQCVDDYISFIPSVEKDLKDTAELLTIYQSLTPGYRKDWARYVYSTTQEETRVKRRAEMKMILQAGYKSRELYRKNQS
ncbi:YdeI/OmpD-associated family protein [Paenibacillus sp. SYP-B3998]|uniref:YdeI/OmpD-associated family protein n=1 Tax=Paenibacillus sp. SYP-B3998 TaxID=2678564 RepID=A0A6G4A3Z1_9BACL|nr:YdeI/OmpD-associated family protein [Paenibacillus sp. SYP-B3998]NEW08367.1 YdeI/OmpD-associated family protein [Paenibacillus sp. SYP-B3998]